MKIGAHYEDYSHLVSKGNITDAKASVVAATNAQKLADEASEALESARQEYLPLIMAFTQVEYH